MGPRTQESIEQAMRLLGRCLVSQEAAIEAASSLKPTDFVDSEHREVFRAIVACAAEGKVRPVTVMRFLHKSSQASSAGAKRMPDLDAYVEAACLPGEVEPIIALLREHGMRRRLHDLGMRLQRLAEEAEDADTLQQGTAEAMQEAVKAMEDAGSSTVTLAEAVTDVVLDAQQPEGARRRRLAFGFPSTLGHALGGLASGAVYILAARTSVGKTALALQMATESCRMGGARSVLYVTLEMPPDQLARRVIQQETGIAPRFGMDLAAEAGDDLVRLQGYPIRFNVRAGLTAPQIATLAQAVSIQHGLDLVVVDYLQRIWLTGKHDSLARAVGEQVARLQDMARALEVPVVLVSQLNRDLERRDSKRPTLADIRDSGMVEEFADVVMAIYRPGYHDARLPENDPRAHMAEVLVLKNRLGPSGMSVPLRWNADRVRFEEPTTEEVDAYERAMTAGRAA